nr:hypothetical protein Iba_chr09eCG9020 [Ipomoea batatas]
MLQHNSTCPSKVLYNYILTLEHQSNHRSISMSVSLSTTTYKHTSGFFWHVQSCHCTLYFCIKGNIIKVTPRAQGCHNMQDLEDKYVGNINSAFQTGFQGLNHGLTVNDDHIAGRANPAFHHRIIHI